MWGLPANHRNGAARGVTFAVTMARQLPMLLDILSDPLLSQG